MMQRWKSSGLRNVGFDSMPSARALISGAPLDRSFAQDGTESPVHASQFTPHVHDRNGLGGTYILVGVQICQGVDRLKTRRNILWSQ
jgi:hypothetical protein